ncbi:MAG: Ig-like domain-containing protein [Candidatus Kryptoniota bacterium]
MRSIRTFILFLIFLATISLPAYASIPTTAKGMWIWQTWLYENGNLDSIISRLKATDVSWVAVKLGDSNSPWNSPGHDFYTWVLGYGGLDSVIIKFHDNGIKFFGWQYVYGASQYSGTGTTATEADVSNEILDLPGIDGFIIDAEIEFEVHGMDTVAALYLDSIRAVHPNSFVALTSFARVTGQPMPWTVFFASCDVNMPQAYWALRPTSVSQEFSAMRSDFESWEQIWINQGYISSIKPIVPIGCEDGEGDGYQEHYGDIQQFCSLSQGVGYVGVSLWEYADMDSMNWSDYAASWANSPPTAPQAVISMPLTAENVPAYDSIKVNFNTPMNAASVLTAFGINPPVKGKLTLNPDFTQWTFVPDTLLPWSTQYTVSIDSSAASLLGIHLTPPYLFEFTTVTIDTTPPLPLTVSPQNGSTSVSHAYFEFILNEPINYNSFVSHLTFADSTGKKASLARDLFQITPNNLTLISFRSALALTPGMKYTAAISPGVVDYYGNPTRTTYSTTFTIDASEATGGSILESFESSSNSWVLAPINHGTIGVDTTMTSFAIQTGKKYDGNEAGGLQYAFDTTNDNAICEVENTQGFDISSSGSVGMWVFGDNSGNELDFVFGSSQQKIVPVDTIEWYGWKFIGMWRNKSDSSINTLKGFAVRRLQAALLSEGALYVDDIQINGKVTGLQSPVGGIPFSFQLFQNYPNPFNPTTVIRYQVSTVSHATLKVYDILGREVKTLVNGIESPGRYQVEFDGSRLSSGVYFYRLTGGNFTDTKKLVLIK